MMLSFDHDNFFFLFFIFRRYKFLIYKFTKSTMNIINSYSGNLITLSLFVLEYHFAVKIKSLGNADLVFL